MKRRSVAVVTGTRADYGLLRWLMAEIQDNQELELFVVATGTHFVPEFGETYRSIIEDGFQIDERVEMLVASDTGVGVAKSTGLGTIGIADAFARLEPDIVVILGDRFEALAAAQAAMFLQIPIAHIAGGELTEGAIDDAIRHAITKMSQLHFTAAEQYRARVVAMGEHPDRVFDFGAVGLDNIARLSLMPAEILSEELQFEIGPGQLAVCTFHPETLSFQSPAEALAPLFAAFEISANLRIIFTKGNADAGGRELNRLVDDFVATHSDRSRAFTSLGQLKYLSLISVADVVIGNSSSGIVEAPSTGTPTVNIGDRQKGRLRAPSVIDATNTAEDIGRSLELALSPEFQSTAALRISPFGAPGAAKKIAQVLSSVSLAELRAKSFYSPEPKDPNELP